MIMTGFFFVEAGLFAVLGILNFVLDNHHPKRPARKARHLIAAIMGVLIALGFGVWSFSVPSLYQYPFLAPFYAFIFVSSLIVTLLKLSQWMAMRNKVIS